MIQKPPEDEAKTQEEDDYYVCSRCSNFKTQRIELYIIHNKAHMDGTLKSTPGKGKKKAPKTNPVQPPKEGKKRSKHVIRMSASKTSTIDEDLALIAKGVIFASSSSEDEAVVLQGNLLLLFIRISDIAEC